MTYYIYDVDGYVNDFATVSGMAEFMEFLEKEGLQETEFFVQEGFCLNPVELRTALVGLQNHPMSGSVKEILDEFIDTLTHCSEIAILYDGVS